jgi:predicted RNA binding protein YcfA (HicA-like mRNA interferase family)
VVKALGRAGFTIARISGSHHVMRHPDGRTVVVPVHVGRDIAKGTLRNILAIIGMDAEDFRKLLRA